MYLMICVLLAFEPVTIAKTEVSLGKGRTWTQDFILAPGDTGKIEATYLRQIGTSCGCLGGIVDFFVYKGENVGKLALCEWHADELQSVWRQRSAKVTYYTKTGGAYTAAVENHSGHRMNLYSVHVERIPTRKKHRSFDGTFKADTSYETTWTKEARKRLIRTEIVRETIWETVHNQVLVGVDTNEVEVMYEKKYVPAGNYTTVTFYIPEGTAVWAYWLGVSEAYSVFKQLFGASVQVAGMMMSPLAAFALGQIGDLATNTSTNLDIDYDLRNQQYGSWNTIVAGGRTKEAYRRMTYGAGRQYSFLLNNSYSMVTPKTVHVKVTGIVIDERYESVTNRVPRVKTKENPIYEHYEVDMPIVDLKIKPVLP